LQNDSIVLVPFRKAVKLNKTISPALLELAHVLSI
jgi:hypothetical protein